MTIRAAPTATGDAAGPMACAVPVVPKQTAARSTWRRADIRAIVEQSMVTCQAVRGAEAGGTAPPTTAPHRAGA